MKNNEELLNKRFIISTEYTGEDPAIWQVLRKIYENSYVCKVIAIKELSCEKDEYIWEETPYIIEEVFNSKLIRDLIQEFNNKKVQILKKDF
jgi:hypothetical protein